LEFRMCSITYQKYTCIFRWHILVGTVKSCANHWINSLQEDIYLQFLAHTISWIVKYLTGQSLRGLSHQWECPPFPNVVILDPEMIESCKLQATKRQLIDKSFVPAWMEISESEMLGIIFFFFWNKRIKFNV
jgi:hypothetical protein